MKAFRQFVDDNGSMDTAYKAGDFKGWLEEQTPKKKEETEDDGDDDSDEIEGEIAT